MAEEAFVIMKRASIFMILAQTIVYFRPQESYEKYLRLLLHLMLLAVLFFPVIELFNKDLGTRMQDSISVYSSQVEELLYGVDAELYTWDDAYLSTMENEIKLRLNKYSDTTGYIVEEAKIQGIDQQEGEGEEGGVTVVIRTRAESQEAANVQVKKITLDPAAGNGDGNRTEEEEELAQSYAQILGMNQENLEVIADGAD